MKKEFGEALLKLAREDMRIVLLTCDVTTPEIEKFAEEFPNRYFNAGLTEQSTIALAGGLAHSGLRPIIYGISPFLLERGFEAIKLNVMQPQLPVIIVGYDYEKYYGPTHTCIDAEMLLNALGIRYWRYNNAPDIDVFRTAVAENVPYYFELRKI